MILDFRFIIDYTHEDVGMSPITSWNVEEGTKFVLSEDITMWDVKILKVLKVMKV